MKPESHNFCCIWKYSLLNFFLFKAFYVHHLYITWIIWCPWFLQISLEWAIIEVRFVKWSINYRRTCYLVSFQLHLNKEELFNCYCTCHIGNLINIVELDLGTISQIIFHFKFKYDINICITSESSAFLWIQILALAISALWCYMWKSCSNHFLKIELERKCIL